VGPRAGLDTEDRGKIFYLCRGLNTCHPVPSQALHYVSYADINRNEACVTKASLRTPLDEADVTSA
jgi:hypothetical protein